MFAASLPIVPPRLDGSSADLWLGLVVVAAVLVATAVFAWFSARRARKDERPDAARIPVGPVEHRKAA